MNRRGRVQPLLLLLTLAVVLVALSIGKIPVSPEHWKEILLGRMDTSAPQWVALVQIRLPRILAALLIGAGLSASGTVFQGLFQNPLVSPHILGVASGSAFGAATFILLGASVPLIRIGAFLFGLLSVVMAYGLGRFHRRSPLLMLVLSGVIIGSLFSALTSFLKYIADPMERMPTIVFWLLGSLNNIGWQDLAYSAPSMVLPLFLLWLYRWRLNLFSLGEEDAKSLGENTELLKALVICCATSITASAVAISGVLGWIGLVIPHMARLLVGSDNRYAIGVSMTLGALYLCLVDTLARSLSGMEIPIGILTAVIGAPTFALLLRRAFPGEGEP